MNIVPPIHPAAYLTTPELFSTQVSPDGQHVAWAWLNQGEHLNVFACPAGRSAERLSDDSTNHWLYSWAADSRHLLYGRECGGGTELVLHDVLDGVARVVATVAPERTVVHALVAPELDAAYVSVMGGGETEIVRLDFASAHETVLFNVPQAEFTLLSLDPSGRYLAFVATSPSGQGTSLYLSRVRDAACLEAAAFEGGLQVRASWHRDGSRLVVLADHPLRTHKRLGLFELRTRALRWLIDDAQRSLEFAFNPPGSDLLAVNEIRQGRAVSALVDPASGHAVDFELPGLQAVPSGYDPQAQAWYAMVYAPQQPADLVCVQAETESGHLQARSVTNLWSYLPFTSAQLFPAQEVSWTSSDGLAIHGYLYRNPNLNRGTVVYIHHGPHEVALPRYDSHVQYLVQAGFNVFEPNYRGSIGYGVQFRNAIYADGWGGMEQHDIRTGIEHLLSQGVARRGRVAVMGYSYGGYSALCQACYVSPELVNAAISINGMTDLAADYAHTDPSIQPCVASAMGGTPEDVPAKYHARSPVNYASLLRADVMLVQGENDTNVHKVNHIHMRAALQAHGKRFSELVFADEGHTILKRMNFQTMMGRIEGFLTLAFYRAYNALG